jgi:ubiquinone/menaquinone biosynthesis C-methylase UbiE
LSESNDWKVPGSGAEVYETVFVPAMMGEWASRGMALANPQSEERVLDVACGTGVLRMRSGSGLRIRSAW